MKIRVDTWKLFCAFRGFPLNSYPYKTKKEGLAPLGLLKQVFTRFGALQLPM